MPDSFSDLDDQHVITVHPDYRKDTFSNLDNHQQTGFAQKADDFVRSSTNAATFGLADRFASMFPDWFPGGGSMEKQRQMDIEADERSPYVTLAGRITGSAVPASRIARGLQFVSPGAFTGAGIAPLSRIGAATGASMSAADDVAHGELPDLGKAVVEGGVGGAAGIGLGILGKLAPWGSPTGRASGQSLTDTDKSGMASLADRANRLGVPLTIPELADAVAPGRSGSAVGAFRSASQSPSGSVAAYNFNRGRVPALDVASDTVANGGVPPGFGNLDEARRAMAEVRGAIAPMNRQPFIDLPDRGDASSSLGHDMLNRGLDRSKANTARFMLNSDNVDLLGTNSPTLSTILSALSGTSNMAANRNYPLPPMFTWGDADAHPRRSSL